MSTEWKEWPDHCYECGYEKPTFEDPRTPPLELGDEVLCKDCYAAAIYDLKEEVECDCEKYTKILDQLGVAV